MLQLPNYSAQLSEPFSSAIEGLKLGASIQDIQLQREMQRRAQQAALERQKTLQAAMAALWQKDQPTARDFLQVASYLPEKDAEQMRKNWESLSSERQQNEIKFSGQLLSAFAADQPQLAIDIMKQRSVAEANQGRKQEAQLWDTQAKLAELNPKAGLKSIGMMMASLPGADKTLTSVLSAYKAPGEARKIEAEALEKEITALGLPQKQAADLGYTKAQAANLYSQIEERAGKLRLDRDKLQSDVEMKLLELNQTRTKLTPETLKTVNDLVINATTADTTANQTADLAGRLEAAGPGGYGGVSTAAEWMAKATGRQDAWTQLRNEYARIKNSIAIKSLPPGPASDKDIILAQKGMPPENADSRIMAQFLRGFSKMQVLDSVTKNAQADWINAVGSLVRTKQDTTVGETVVPGNTSFQTYLNAILEKQTKTKMDAIGAKSAIQGREKSYLRHWQR